MLDGSLGFSGLIFVSVGGFKEVARYINLKIFPLLKNKDIFGSVNSDF